MIAPTSHRHALGGRTERAPANWNAAQTLEAFSQHLPPPPRPVPDSHARKLRVASSPPDSKISTPGADLSSPAFGPCRMNRARPQ